MYNAKLKQHSVETAASILAALHAPPFTAEELAIHLELADEILCLVPAKLTMQMGLHALGIPKPPHGKTRDWQVAEFLKMYGKFIESAVGFPLPAPSAQQMRDAAFWGTWRQPALNAEDKLLERNGDWSKMNKKEMLALLASRTGGASGYTFEADAGTIRTKLAEVMAAESNSQVPPMPQRPERKDGAGGGGADPHVILYEGQGMAPLWVIIRTLGAAPRTLNASALSNRPSLCFPAVEAAIGFPPSFAVLGFGELRAAARHCRTRRSRPSRLYARRAWTST